MMKTIKSQQLEAGFFQAFGRAIYIHDQLQPDAQTDIQAYYGQLAIMDCDQPLQIGICAAKNRPYIVDQLEQHAETAELLVALKGDFVTPVTVSKVVDGKQYPDMDKVAAIRVNQGQGVLFNKGIWHWTPYAVAEACDILVVFKKDTPKNDFISCKLQEKLMITL